MKKPIIIVVMLLLVMLSPVQKSHAQIPILEIIKAGVKKVIRAVDLKIQRQQNKVIWLQNAQKLLENALSKLKLSEIGDWTEKQKELYKTYFEDLKKVKAVITYYQRVREVLEKQKLVVSEYQRAWALVKNDKHFTPSEIEYIGRVYKGILEHSADNLEELYLVINSFRTQMTDAKRLEMIEGAAIKVQQNYIDLRAFNGDNAMLSLQRSKSQQEVDMVRKLYGIQ